MEVEYHEEYVLLDAHFYKFWMKMTEFIKYCVPTIIYKNEY